MPNIRSAAFTVHANGRENRQGASTVKHFAQAEQSGFEFGDRNFDDGMGVHDGG